MAQINYATTRHYSKINVNDLFVDLFDGEIILIVSSLEEYNQDIKFFSILAVSSTKIGLRDWDYEFETFHSHWRKIICDENE